MKELLTIDRKFFDLETSELYDYCKSKADIFSNYALIGIDYQQKYFTVYQADSIQKLFNEIFEVMPEHEITLNQNNYVEHEEGYETLELTDKQYKEIIEDCTDYRHCLLIKNIEN